MSTNPSFDKDKFAAAAASYASDKVSGTADDYKKTIDKYKEMASSAGLNGMDGFFAGIQTLITKVQDFFSGLIKRWLPQADSEAAADTVAPTIPSQPPQNEAAARAAAAKVRTGEVKLAESNAPATAPASPKTSRQVG